MCFDERHAVQIEGTRFRSLSSEVSYSVEILLVLVIHERIRMNDVMDLRKYPTYQIIPGAKISLSD